MSSESALAGLAAIVATVLWLERSALLAPLFRRLPAVFWIYLFPMFLVQLGWFDAEAVARLKLSSWLLPPALVLLFVGSDVRGLVRLGFPALVAMAASAAGVVLGGIVTFLVFGRALGPEAAEVLAALVATWIGGSANLIAVAEGLGVSPRSQGLAILVDTLIGYSWMAGLLVLASYQHVLDRWLHADRRKVQEIGSRVTRLEGPRAGGFDLAAAATAVALALGVSAVARKLGSAIAIKFDWLDMSAWTVLLVTSISLCLALTPAQRLGSAGAQTLGLVSFYLLLASIGARADLSRLQESPIWLVGGASILLVHGALLLAVLRVTRLPSFFFGAASQAAVGGYASAPIVAESYERGLASVGLLLAVVGNLLGTYVGLALGIFLRSLADIVR